MADDGRRQKKRYDRASRHLTQSRQAAKKNARHFALLVIFFNVSDPGDLRVLSGFA